MTDERGQPPVTCWECEATTSQPFVVTIEIPSEHRPRVKLCPSCYELHYVPLIVEASADAEVPAGPALCSPSADCTRH